MKIYSISKLFLIKMKSIMASRTFNIIEDPRDMMIKLEELA